MYEVRISISSYVPYPGPCLSIFSISSAGREPRTAADASFREAHTYIRVGTPSLGFCSTKYAGMREYDNNLRCTHKYKTYTIHTFVYTYVSHGRTVSEHVTLGSGKKGRQEAQESPRHPPGLFGISVDVFLFLSLSVLAKYVRRHHFCPFDRQHLHPLTGRTSTP